MSHGRAPIDPAEADAGIDLRAVEDSRFGVEWVGFGLLLLFASVGLWGLDTSRPAALVALGLRGSGLAILLVGLAWGAPTPNGPLPQWARSGARALLGLTLVGEARAVLAPALLPSVAPTFAALERFCELAGLALLWVLWRFCHDRGLTGRALVWLWGALAGTGMALIVVLTRADWMVRFFPALGALAWISARTTSRDLWQDAVSRRTRRVLRDEHKPSAPP